MWCPRRRGAAAKPCEDLDWSRWQRPLRDVRKACLLSHRVCVGRRVVAAASRSSSWRGEGEWEPPRPPRWGGALMPSVAPFLAQASLILRAVNHLSSWKHAAVKTVGAAHRRWPDCGAAGSSTEAGPRLMSFGRRGAKLLEAVGKVPGARDA